ncbi:hypothetical protein [Jiangella aurantiaca]|nr:hypothetical protein [Jiangella aurantiaca]
MEKITVYLPEDPSKAATRVARQRGVSEPQRRAVEEAIFATGEPLIVSP